MSVYYRIGKQTVEGPRTDVKSYKYGSEFSFIFDSIKSLIEFENWGWKDGKTLLQSALQKETWPFILLEIF